ncbi:bifunctional sulfate adenylyltransferase subunit 1/adenylylsulfate kinase protein, partial [mine drainage metagenome]
MAALLPEHYVTPVEKDRILRKIRHERAPAWDLTRRQLCDLELILNGAFHPLSGFLGPDDYRSVVVKGRLRDGTLWPIPIVLDLPESFAAKLAPGTLLELRESEGIPVAVLEVETLDRPDRVEEALRVFGTDDPTHPGVRYLLESTHPVYVSGALRGLAPPPHYDFRPLRMTPNELRAKFDALGWRRVIAFQTRNSPPPRPCRTHLPGRERTGGQSLPA